MQSLRNLRKLMRPLAVFALLQILSACKKTTADSAALRVDPGSAVNFVWGPALFGQSLTFTSGTFKIFRTNAYKDDPFSDTAVSANIVTQKYSKIESRYDLDLLRVKARSADKKLIELAAFAIDSTVEIDMASTMAVNWFFNVLKRSPKDEAEVVRVVTVFRNGLLSSCFDKDVVLPTLDALVRAAQIALIDSPDFKALVDEYKIKSRDVELFVGKNTPPRLTTQSPFYSRIDDPYDDKVGENEVFSELTNAEDSDHDMFTARWYFNGKLADKSMVTFKTDSTIPEAFWIPKKLAFDTSFDDSTTARTREINMEMVLCDGGNAQHYKYHLAVNNVNRPPEIVGVYNMDGTPHPLDQVEQIPEFDKNNQAATTKVLRVVVEDPDGDPLRVNLDSTSDANTYLSLRPDGSPLDLLDGDWVGSASSDSVNTGIWQIAWPAKVLQMRSPSGVRFYHNNGVGRVLIKGFPYAWVAGGVAASEADTDVAYEIYQPFQKDTVGIMLKNVPVIAQPVAVTNVDIPCTLKFSRANLSFDLTCSMYHDPKTKDDFEYRTTYSCPQIEILQAGTLANQACLGLPVVAVSTSDQGTRSHGEFYMFIQPSNQAAKLNSTNIKATVTDTGGLAAYAPLYFSVLDRNTAPVISKVSRVMARNPITMDTDNPPMIEDNSGWASYFDFNDTSSYYGSTRQMYEWDEGQPIYDYVTGSRKDAWLENIRWRKASQSEPSTMGLFSTYDYFALDFKKVDSDNTIITFGMAQTNLLQTAARTTLLSRKAKVYGEDADHDVYIRIFNYFPDTQSLPHATGPAYNTDAICRMANWFKRTELDPSFQDAAKYKANPPDSDVKVLCVPAPTTCDRLTGDLTCAKALTSSTLALGTLENNGVRFTMPIERYMWAARVDPTKVTTMMYGNTLDGSLGWGPHIHVAGQPKDNDSTWYYSNQNNYTVFYGMNYRWEYGIDSFWDSGTQEDLIDNSEKTLLVRHRYERYYYYLQPYTDHYRKVMINQQQRTIRFSGDDGGLAAAYPSYITALSVQNGCRYAFRNRGQRLVLTCGSNTAASAAVIPKLYDDVLASPVANTFTLDYQVYHNIPDAGNNYKYRYATQDYSNDIVEIAPGVKKVNFDAAVNHEPKWDNFTAAAWTPFVLIGSYSDLDAQGISVENRDRLTFATRVVKSYGASAITDAKGDTAVVYRNFDPKDTSVALGGLRVKYNAPCTDGSSQNQFDPEQGGSGATFANPGEISIENLADDEFAVVYYPQTWCADGVVDPSTQIIELSISDPGSATSPSTTAKLQFRPRFVNPPYPPMLYGWGSNCDTQTDPAWEPHPYYPSAVTDIDNKKRILVQYGYGDVQGSFDRSMSIASRLTGGLTQNNYGCQLYSWDQNSPMESVNFGFVKTKTNAADPGHYIDPTQDSNDPGLVLAQTYWQNADHMSLDTSSGGLLGTTPEAGSSHAICASPTVVPSSGCSSGLVPMPSGFPNLFTRWTTTDTPTVTAGNSPTRTVGGGFDIWTSYKTLGFRNAYVVPGNKSFYMTLSKTGIKEENIQCAQDRPYYIQQLKAGAKHVTILDGSGNVVHPTTLAAFTTNWNENALCYEIKPGTANDFVRLHAAVPPAGQAPTPPDFDISFKVYNFARFLYPDLADGTPNVDYTCKTSLKYGLVYEDANLKLQCEPINNASYSTYKVTNFISPYRTQLASEYNDGSLLSNFYVYSFYSGWDYSLFLSWGENRAMTSAESPGRFQGVFAADDGKYRTIMPIKLQANDVQVAPVLDVNPGITTMSMQKDVTTPALGVPSQDFTIDNIIARTQTGRYPTFIDLIPDPTDTNVKNDFSAFYTHLMPQLSTAVADETDHADYAAVTIDGTGEHAITGSSGPVRMTAGDMQVAHQADRLLPVYLPHAITDDVPAQSFPYAFFATETVAGVPTQVNMLRNFASGHESDESYFPVRKPALVLQKREFSDAQVTSTYQFSMSVPGMKDAYQDRYPWYVSFHTQAAIQMPMEFYAGTVSQLVPDVGHYERQNGNAYSTWKIDIPRTVAYDTYQGTQYTGAPLFTYTGVAAPATDTITQHLRIGVHEKNLPPCIEPVTFFKQYTDQATLKTTYGVACPTPADLSVPSPNPTDGSRNMGNLGHGVNYTCAKDTSNQCINQSILESTVADNLDAYLNAKYSADFSHVTYEDIVEGEEFRILLGFHDPNRAEGIRIAAVDLQPPYMSPAYSNGHSVSIDGMLASAPNKLLPDLYTFKSTDGRDTPNVEYGIRWTLQDIHVAKLDQLDHDTKIDPNRRTPVPSMNLRVSDQSNFPGSMHRDYNLSIYGWDKNFAPSPVYVVDFRQRNSMSAGADQSSGVGKSNAVQYAYEVNPTHDTCTLQTCNSFVFATVDEDRGDDLIVNLKNIDGQAPITGADLVTETVSRADCLTFLSRADRIVDDQQPISCFRVMYRVRDVSKSNMNFLLEIKDKPWWQKDWGGALAFDPRTRGYTLTPSQYGVAGNHPHPELVQSQTISVNISATPGGKGFLLPVEPLPIAYLGELYHQDVLFYSPQSKDVNCALSRRPTLSDYTLTTELPAAGLSLSADEVMTATAYKTSDPHYTRCEILWKPIVNFWTNDLHRTNVIVDFTENGAYIDSVSYKINNEIDTGYNDGARLPNSNAYRNMHINTDNLGIAVTAAGGYTIGTTFYGAEGTDWTFTLWDTTTNLAASFNNPHQPVSTTWYLDGVPVSTDNTTPVGNTTTFKFSGLNFIKNFGSDTAGPHVIKVFVTDGGKGICTTCGTIQRTIYVRNTLVGLMSKNPSMSILPLNFDSTADSFSLIGFNGTKSDSEFYAAAKVTLGGRDRTQVNFGQFSTNNNPALNVLQTGVVASAAPFAQFSYVNDTNGDSIVGLATSDGTTAKNGSLPSGFTTAFYRRDSTKALFKISPNQNDQSTFLFYNSVENTGGVASFEGVNDAGLGYYLVGSSSAVSGRGTSSLWLHKSDNTVVGRFAVGSSGSPVSIIDYSLVSIAKASTTAKAYILILAADGLYSLPWGTGSCNGSGQWYVPYGATDNPSTSISPCSNATRILAPPSGKTWSKGRIIMDARFRIATNVTSQLVAIWTGVDNDANGQLRTFSATRNGSDQIPIQDTDNTVVTGFDFFPTGLDLSSSVKTPLAVMGADTLTIKIAKPNSATIASIDLNASGANRVKTTLIPGAGKIQALSCHLASETCYAFDSDFGLVWRLK